MNKKFLMFGLLIVFCILIIFIIILKNNYKNDNTGNNITNITLDKCEEYIFSINSYEVLAEVTINSNKNSNKYLVKQIVNENNAVQEILEPSNIKGIKFMYDDGKLVVENSELKLQKVYENYPYIAENIMFLNDFIIEYKENKKEGNAKINENNDSIIFVIEDKKEIKKELYISKDTVKPKKLIMEDNNKKDIVYIEYKETKINN